MNLIFAIIAVYMIVVIVPFPVYMVFSKYAGLAEPENPSEFFASMLVQKIGTTVGFVFLFYIVRETLSEQWLTYALIWVAMYAITEIGQAMGPNYGWKEAFAGIIAEAIYFPLAGFVMVELVG